MLAKLKRRSNARRGKSGKLVPKVSPGSPPRARAGALPYRRPPIKPGTPHPGSPWIDGLEAADRVLFPGLENGALCRKLREAASPTFNLTYRHAREAMFSHIWNEQGVVRDVYTGKEIRTEGIPNARGEDGMNTEHVWPRTFGSSEGVKGTHGITDLHNLLPTAATANNRRMSHPYGEVVRATWENNGARLGFDATGRTVFEPPDAVKGEVARRRFAVSVVQNLSLPLFEEETLRAWHAAHPVTQAERERNRLIAAYQGNVNPFVVQPSLVDRISRFTRDPQTPPQGYGRTLRVFDEGYRSTQA